MSQPSDWRNASAYDYVLELTPSQLAWEFLRRNRSYQDDFLQLTALSAPLDHATFIERWGLCFRGRP
jgi:hypothetical protein